MPSIIDSTNDNAIFVTAPIFSPVVQDSIRQVPSSIRVQNLAREQSLQNSDDSPMKSETAKNTLDVHDLREIIKQQQAVCEALLPMKVLKSNFVCKCDSL